LAHWAKFGPLGECLGTLSIFYITKVAHILGLFFHSEGYSLILTKYSLGEFFTDPSGHSDIPTCFIFKSFFCSTNMTYIGMYFEAQELILGLRTGPEIHLFSFLSIFVSRISTDTFHSDAISGTTRNVLG
jgi:hypothetical protein